MYPLEISLATGAETFAHLDFVLDAPLPIEWSRTDRSKLSAYDRGHLGARWLTPYSMRIDVVGKGKPAGLVYRAADARSHRYPWLGIGERHYDPVELITLTRMSATLLTLDFGKLLPEGEPSQINIVDPKYRNSKTIPRGNV